MCSSCEKNLFLYNEKILLFKIFIFLTSIIIALFSLELFFRINSGFGYKYALPRFKSDKSSDISQWPWLQPSALLGYEHIPNFGSYGLVGRINSFGLVGREHNLYKENGTFRILVLGDSIAEQGWPCEFLEDYLNNNVYLFNSRYKKLEIWNAGVASYDVRRYLIYLKHRGLGFNPDMIIIFFCLNDFNLNTNIYYRTKNGTNGYYFSISELSKVYKVNTFLMKHSYLYRFIILRIDSYLLSKKINNGNIFLPEENGRYYLRLIKDICQRQRIPLFAVIFPYLKPLSECTDGERYEYQTIRKVTNELGIDFLNLYEYLPEKELLNLRAVKEDFIHPSQEGHRFIAKLIYDFLLKKFFKNKLN